ncbi:MAG: ASCH domain-containing protein [Prevotella sp.]|jgi:Zn ribbon nucleic-acid-binding protein|nr:ASCH domain-containing protein [Prevotella sp.]
MKAITLKQPWAYLVCAGIKPVENRKWRTHRRDRVLIHASANPKVNLMDLVCSGFFNEEQKKEVIFNVQNAKRSGELNTGAIIGSVDIVDCVGASPDMTDCSGAHPSIWAEPDCFHWVLENPFIFENPAINVRGKLSFWESGYIEVICPECGRRQLHNSTVGGIQSIGWGNPIHECEACGYTITESEF